MSIKMTRKDLLERAAAQEAALGAGMAQLAGVKTNPLGGALVGAGLAALALAGGRAIGARRGAMAAEAAAEDLHEAVQQTAKAPLGDALAQAQALIAQIEAELAPLGTSAAEQVDALRAQAGEAMAAGRAAAAEGLAQGADRARAHPYGATALGLALVAGVSALFPRLRGTVTPVATAASAAVAAQGALHHPAVRAQLQQAQDGLAGISTAAAQKLQDERDAALAQVADLRARLEREVARAARAGSKLRAAARGNGALTH